MAPPHLLSPRGYEDYLPAHVGSPHLEGKAAGLVLPRCTTDGMSLHLEEISQAVAPGAHALVLLDQAGWHQSKRLVVPSNVL